MQSLRCCDSTQTRYSVGEHEERRAPARAGVVLKTVHANGRSAGMPWHPAKLLSRHQRAGRARFLISGSHSLQQLRFARITGAEALIRFLISIRRERSFQGDVHSSNFHRIKQPSWTIKDSKGGFNRSTIHFPLIESLPDRIRARTPQIRRVRRCDRLKQPRGKGSGEGGKINQLGCFPGDCVSGCASSSRRESIVGLSAPTTTANKKDKGWERGELVRHVDRAWSVPSPSYPSPSPPSEIRTRHCGCADR